MDVMVKRDAGCWMPGAGSRALGLALVALMLAGCKSPPAPYTGYVPEEEQGVMTVGLDDHDYDVAVQDVVAAMTARGLPEGYVVALGPVDTRECAYDIRIRQIQDSMQYNLELNGRLRFTMMDSALYGDNALAESYKIMEYNWFHNNPLSAEDLYVFGSRAEINAILFGRVSCMERPLPGGGAEITYRFVWRLANTKTGLIDLTHEKRIRKNVR